MLPVWQQADRDRDRAQAGLKASAGKRQKNKDAPDGTKWCNRCGEYRRLVDFTPNRRMASGVASYCRLCSSTYMHELRLKREFGLTIEDYDRLLAQQDGRCAICMRKPRARRLAVDHNHTTGEVRGLLCTRCNHGLLGKANDRATLLRRAAHYLERPPAVSGDPLEALDEFEAERVANLLEDWDGLEPLHYESEGEAYVSVTLAQFADLATRAGLTIEVDR